MQYLVGVQVTLISVHCYCECCGTNISQLNKKTFWSKDFISWKKWKKFTDIQKLETVEFNEFFRFFSRHKGPWWEEKFSPGHLAKAILKRNQMINILSGVVSLEIFECWKRLKITRFDQGIFYLFQLACSFCFHVEVTITNVLLVECKFFVAFYKNICWVVKWKSSKRLAYFITRISNYFSKNTCFWEFKNLTSIQAILLKKCPHCSEGKEEITSAHEATIEDLRICNS